MIGSETTTRPTEIQNQYLFIKKKKKKRKKSELMDLNPQKHCKHYILIRYHQNVMIYFNI